MKSIKFTTAFGIAAVVFGAWWIYASSVVPFLHIFFSDEKEVGDYVFAMTILPAMAIPGVLAAYFGFRLTKEKKKKNIKGTVGAIAFFGAIWISARVGNMLGEFEGIEMLSPLVGSCCAILCYVALSNFLMKKEGLSPAKGEFIGKGIVTLIALQIWLASFELIETISPVKNGFTYVKQEPWGWAGFVGPIFLAWVFYRIAMRVIEKNSVDRGASSDSKNVAVPLC